MTSQPPNIPQFDSRSLVLYLWENLEVIKRHWVLFLVVVVLCSVAAGYGVRQFDARQIDILTTNNNLLKDHNTTLQTIATITPPSQWRRLSDSARNQILASMKAMSSPPKTIIIYAMAETESRQYAAQFADAFRSIGIQVQPREISSFMNLPDIGLMVGLTGFPNPSPEASKFKDILTNAGLEVHYVQWSSTGEEIDKAKIDYDLYVGSKPW